MRCKGAGHAIIWLRKRIFVSLPGQHFAHIFVDPTHSLEWTYHHLKVNNLIAVFPHQHIYAIHGNTINFHLKL